MENTVLRLSNLGYVVVPSRVVKATDVDGGFLGRRTV